MARGRDVRQTQPDCAKMHSSALLSRPKQACPCRVSPRARQIQVSPSEELLSRAAVRKPLQRPYQWRCIAHLRCAAPSLLRDRKLIRQAVSDAPAPHCNHHPPARQSRAASPPPPGGMLLRYAVRTAPPHTISKLPHLHISDVQPPPSPHGEGAYAPCCQDG